MFRIRILVCAMYNSKEIVQLKCQSEVTFSWDDKNLPHYDKWCEYFYHIWIFAKKISNFSKKSCRQFTKTKLKFRRKWASPQFYQKKRYILLTVQKLFERYFWQNFLKFYDKMDLPIQMRIIVTKERTQNIVTPFVWNL